jgi:hypothetical protein
LVLTYNPSRQPQVNAQGQSTAKKPQANQAKPQAKNP